MSILAVVLALIGGLGALLSMLTGIICGIPAVILGLLACILGFLAWKKSRKGVPAIFFGFIAVVLAVMLTGFIGLMMVSNDPEEDKAITEEVIALIKGELPKTAAAEQAEPVAEAEF